jgi:uncharacterized membrane-anchored protein
MLALPKIVLLFVLLLVVWWAVRRFNRPSPKLARRRPAASRRPQAAVEDLTACRICGTYVAAGARGCGKAGCPRPV